MTREPVYNAPTGSRLVLDGRHWLVTGEERDGYAVEGVEDGECVTLSFARIARAVRDGVCEITRPADDEKHRALLDYTGGVEFLEQLPEAQRDLVRTRLAIVLAMLEMEREGIKLTQRAMDVGPLRDALKKRAAAIARGDALSEPARGGKIGARFVWPKGRTLRRYADLYVKFGGNPLVLMNREHLKGPHGLRRLSGLQEQFVSYAIACWRKPQQPQLAPLLALATEVFHVPPEELAGGFRFPSITTIRTRINPKRRALENEHLKAARARRARESGFFPDSRDPSNYATIETLQKRADRTASVEIRPPRKTGPTGSPGGVTDRSATAPVHRVGGRAASSSTPPVALPAPAPSDATTFAPITKGKL